MGAPATWFDSRGLVLGGSAGEERRLEFYAAEVHYWRLERKDWAGCLAAVRELGFELVSSYVPWGVHEVAPGRHDWSGALDVAGFVDEAARAGLSVLLKPGPHINAELTRFGLPERVVRDPAMQARTGRDTPAWMPSPPQMFPVPSYASHAFQRATGDWLRAFGEVIGPRLHPAGPVVALQVDNELQQFFRLGAYDLDYHPDALSWWREMSGEAEPPRVWDPADARRCALWVRFKEEYAERALAWVTAGLEAAGLGAVARTHNAPPSLPALVHLPRAARAIGGPCGLDFYHRARDYEEVRRRALYLAGSAHPIPIAAEVGVGGPPWLPPMSDEDQAEVTRGILAGGARGLGFFMVVDRERWYGAALGRRGEERGPAARLRALIAALREIEWSALLRRANVALVVSRAESRFALASSVADPLTPVAAELLGLGPAGAAELALDRGAALHRRWEAAASSALDRAGLPWQLVDEEAPDELFARHRLFVLPTLGRVDRALWRRLHAAAARGARIVIGPERPTRDELDQPLGEEAAPPRRAGLMRPGSLDDVAGLARDLAAAAGEQTPPVRSAIAGPFVHVSLFDDESGAARAVALGNPSGAACAAVIEVRPGIALRDLISGESFAPADRTLAIELGAYAWRLLAIEHR